MYFIYNNNNNKGNTSPYLGNTLEKKKRTISKTFSVERQVSVVKITDGKRTPPKRIRVMGEIMAKSANILSNKTNLCVCLKERR